MLALHGRDRALLIAEPAAPSGSENAVLEDTPAQSTIGARCERPEGRRT